MNKKIVIVGGGTAGWLTAAVLAAEFTAGVEITLIESPEVSPIGVGEGTWPTMRSTLKRIGIRETEFLRACSASFKQGSKFVGWRNGASDDFYYHPFTLPASFSDVDYHRLWQEGAEPAYDRVAGIQSRLCEMAKAPKTITVPEYAGALNYGYHLDAGKFSELLQSHCTNRLSVEHIVDHVDRVNLANSGDIESVVTKECGEIAGDLFIDCSGSKSLLLGETLGVGFVPCGQYSMNDRALAVQVGYPSADAEVASATIGTAQEAGWTWDIGLSSRRGVGYVYSSAHTSEEQAERCLKRYLRETAPHLKEAEIEPRALRFNPGYREKFWHKNCVAVGMAAGFIEPLEASALALVELSAAMIRDELPSDRLEMEVVAKRFNQIFSYRWQRIIEFLKLHYVLSERRDTQYWHDAVAKESTPQTLLDSLTIWQSRSPYSRDFLHTEELFPAPSYAYVLYGMGFGKCASGITRTRDEARVQQVLAQEQKKLHNYMQAIPGNRELLDAVSQYGLSLV
ncbi:tryptophan halogenase family protein [Gilvimarinus xylanilyticus]|uniref:Tryptophan 7-halogenase n=1 Tax=Gilvimarinus xylanilyticus TaxID=2944139 RepID=A0A9X2I0W0_9GAMM|nr:tryptophan halogenase family protein [Gilvimarinus xylanilyticus]MCP8898146.1 tryptophan 7-halogenase [Gilvimarinus xylanilyticus]